MDTRKVFVVGSGIMGSGIVQCCAQAGYPVTMMDVDADAIEHAVERIGFSLAKLEGKALLREHSKDILARIDTSGTFEAARDADFVIEAVYEDLETKRSVFEKLDAMCREDTVLGTNTSSFPITEIAPCEASSHRVIGVHFFNPVHRMKLVEIIRGISTSDETLEKTRRFILSLEKEPVIVNRDTAGFIVNRINGMAFLEALRLVEKGIARAEDVDKAMRLGLGHPMGPFELMDMVGLDVVLKARLGIYNETREPLHYPPGILRRMVSAGYLGRKSGKGFYDYTK